jgi:hypothetical protein
MSTGRSYFGISQHHFIQLDTQNWQAKTQLNFFLNSLFQFSSKKVPIFFFLLTDIF